MDTPVEFDSKNRPTHSYLRTASRNAVTGMFRSVPEYIEEQGDLYES